MSEWSLIGGNPAPGSVPAVADLAESLRTVARNAIGVQQRLERLSKSALSSLWVGQSADAFTLQMVELPAMSDKVFQSFSTAGQNLLTYSSELDALQARARACLERARQAESDLSSARAARQSAIERVERQADADGLNLVESWFARREVAGDYDSRIERAKNELEAERREARFIQDDHERAIDAAVKGINEAREQGVRNAIRFSLFGIAPFGESATLRDLGVSFGESYNRWKPALVAVSILIFVVVTAGAGTPLIGAAGAALTYASVANTSTKMVRKGTGEELDESWAALSFAMGMDVVSLGVTKHAASLRGNVATQQVDASVSARLARKFDAEALRYARINRPPAPLEASLTMRRLAVNRALRSDILIRDLPRLERAYRNAEAIARGIDSAGLGKELFELQRERRIPPPTLTRCTGPVPMAPIAP